MYGCALGSFGMYMLVDASFVKCYMILSCEYNASHALNWVLMAIACLICALNHVLFIWNQRSIYHRECLAYMLPCGEA
jgi:hypothetical protein